MTTSPAAQESSPPLVARTRHDLLAAIASTLGCWPEESLVLALALPGGLGPVLRLDLPEDPERLDDWADALDALTPLLDRIGRGGRVFTAAFTRRTELLDRAEEPSFGTRRHAPDERGGSGVAGGPEDGSAAEWVPDFLCSTAALMASLEAMRFGWEQGCSPREMWVVDRTHDRWGTLPSLQGDDGEGTDLSRSPNAPDDDLVPAALRPCWRVEGAGTVRSVLASPLALSLGLEGRPVPTGYGGALDRGSLPGPFDLAAELGASAASAYRRGLREAVAERVRTMDPDELLLRTGLPLTSEELGTLERCLSGLAAQVREATQGEGPLRRAMLSGTDRVELALCGAGLQRLSMLCLLLSLAALGPEAVGAHAATCRAVARGEALSGPGTGGERQPTAVHQLLRGRHEGPVDRHRIQALRFLLTVLEQSLGEPEASAAALANAYLSWFVGSNTQAEAYLRRVEDPRLDHEVDLFLRARHEVPLPWWLARRPEDPGGFGEGDELVRRIREARE